MVPKILVTTGCSYGKFPNVFSKKLINKIDNLELVIDLHSVSLGSSFQSISIIETVDKLLSMGIQADDIFVLGQFSEISRRDIVIQNQTLVNEIDATTFSEFVNGKNWERLPLKYPNCVPIKESIVLNTIKDLVVEKIALRDYAKFNNYYITNMERRHKTNFANKIIQPISDNYTYALDIDISGITYIDRIAIETIDRGIKYFQNILTTEHYLKSKGIKYKFCLINNQFSMYDESGLQKDKQTKIVDGEHFLNQDYKNSKQIWEINSMIKILYEMIDWSNWWFYENKDKNIIWGGIDEYAIDNFGIEVYGARINDKNLFGQHPDDIVYVKLFEEIMKEYI